MITVRRITRGSTSIGIILDSVPEDQPQAETIAAAARFANETLDRFHDATAQRFSLEPGAVLVTLYKD